MVNNTTRWRCYTLKRSFTIGLVWTGITVCVMSFGFTVFLIENSARSKNIEKKNEIQNSKKEYLTNETSIRTNELASLDRKEPDEKAEKEVQEKRITNDKMNVIKNAKTNEEEVEGVEIISLNANDFIKPVKGEILNPLSIDNLAFSKTLNEWRVHTGVDYMAHIGYAVYAVCNGIIKEINFDQAYGNYIVIEHEEGYKSMYSNITVLSNLKVGDEIKKGEIIGYIAESFGFESAEETHLHFELKKDKKYIAI